MKLLRTMSFFAKASKDDAKIRKMSKQAKTYFFTRKVRIKPMICLRKKKAMSK